MPGAVGPLNKMKKKLKHPMSAYVVALPPRYYSEELAALGIDEPAYGKLYPKVMLERDIHDSRTTRSGEDEDQESLAQKFDIVIAAIQARNHTFERVAGLPMRIDNPDRFRFVHVPKD